jgi:hypothetical protein
MLTLGTTHIAAMVYVDYLIRAKVPSVIDMMEEPDRSFLMASSLPPGPPWNHYVPGIKGVMGRGLVEETKAFDTYRREHAVREAMHGRNLPYHFPSWRQYKFTRAGVLARGLLSEAGVWQEFSEQLAAHRASRIRIA